MIDDPDEDQLFQEIVNNSNLEDLQSENEKHTLTLGDVYEGIAIVSQVQVEIHRYLQGVMSAIYENNKAGEVVKDFPAITPTQASCLLAIFEAAAVFLEG